MSKKDPAEKAVRDIRRKTRKQFPWRWESGTNSTNLDGILSVKTMAA